MFIRQIKTDWHVIYVWILSRKDAKSLKLYRYLQKFDDVELWRIHNDFELIAAALKGTEYELISQNLCDMIDSIKRQRAA